MFFPIDETSVRVEDYVKDKKIKNIIASYMQNEEFIKNELRTYLKENKFVKYCSNGEFFIKLNYNRKFKDKYIDGNEDIDLFTKELINDFFYKLTNVQKNFSKYFDILYLDKKILISI